MRVLGVVVALIAGVGSAGAQDRATQYRDQLQREGILKEATIDGYRLCYADRGAGPVVVLLHGLGGSLYDWRGNHGPIAAAGFRVIALDVLGAGESEKPEEADYSVFAQARRVKRLLDELQVDRAVLVGNSYGGGIALAFAQDWPDRTERLVLIDSVCYPEDIPAYVRLCRIPWLSEQVACILPVEMMTEAALSKNYADPARVKPDEIGAYVGELDPPERRKALIRTVRALVPDDSSEFLRRLSRVEARTLILWGDKDATRPVEHGRRLQKDLPNATLEVLEGVGHMPNQEVPERVNRLVVDFLK